MTKWNKVVVLSGALGGFALAACGADVENTDDFAPRAPTYAAPSASADELILPEEPQPAGGFVLAEFEGFVDPLSGTFDIQMLDEQIVFPEAEAAGLRTVDQALFCNLRIDSDSNVGTGRPSSVELVTELRDWDENPGTPDGPSGLHEECCAAGAAGCVSNSPEVLYQQGLQGAFCGEVTARSFYASTNLSDVHAELYFVFPAAGHSGYPHPLGTGAQPYGGLSNEYGLWAYGDLGVADGRVGPPFGSPPDEVTRRWVFQNSDDSPFRFRGRIRASFIEICNGNDDDCDGRIDEGANCLADGQPCLDGSDCIADICVSGACGIPVTPDFVLENVIAIGGGGTTANAFNSVELRIGAPAPMGSATSAANRLILGPLSDR